MPDDRNLFLNWELAKLLCVAAATFVFAMWLAGNSTAHKETQSGEREPDTADYSKVEIYLETSADLWRDDSALKEPYLYSNPPHPEWASAGAKAEVDAVHLEPYKTDEKGNTYLDIDREIDYVLVARAMAIANDKTDAPKEDPAIGTLEIDLKPVEINGVPVLDEDGKPMKRWFPEPVRVSVHANAQDDGGTRHYAYAYGRASTEGVKGN